MSFSTMNISVTMTGEEWVSVMGYLTRRDLSPKGKALLNSGLKKMRDRVTAASKNESEARKPRTAAGSLD